MEPDHVTSEAITAGVRKLVEAGAKAVVLIGSHARGQAKPLSDIDLYAIGSGPTYQLDVHQGMLISTSWRTTSEIIESFMAPATAGAAIPAWRSARILHDPNGTARDLITRANRWTWHDIGDDRIDSWVAEELTGYAEEARKLVSMLTHGRLQQAAVQRSILALRLPMVMATYLRLLYDSENALWDLVADRMGAEWRQAQVTALGLTGRSPTETCEAALAMFTYSCTTLRDVLNARQRAVVDNALSLIPPSEARPAIHCTVVIFIELDGGFLLIRELGKGLDRGWYFPAGAVEPGESLFDAARREALEETGIDVEPAYVLRIDHGYFPSAPDTPWWRFVIVAHPVSDTAPAATEPGIHAIEWISPDKLADLPLRAPDAEAIMRAHLDVKTGRNSPSYHFSPDGTLAGFFH